MINISVKNYSVLFQCSTYIRERYNRKVNKNFTDLAWYISYYNIYRHFYCIYIFWCSCQLSCASAFKAKTTFNSARLRWDFWNFHGAEDLSRINSSPAWAARGERGGEDFLLLKSSEFKNLASELTMTFAVSTVPVTAVLSYTFDVKEYDFDNQIEANKKLGI